jgi:hypothetical protein
MAFLHVPGGDGLQLWRAAMDTLNKQSRTAEKGCFSGLGLPTERTQRCVAEYGVELLNLFINL